MDHHELHAGPGEKGFAKAFGLPLSSQIGLENQRLPAHLVCVQRGWINVDIDEIMCESCGAYLSFVSLSSRIPAEVDNPGRAFGKQLDAEHEVNCPWGRNSCPESMI